MLFCCNTTLFLFNTGIFLEKKMNVMRCKITPIVMLYVRLKALNDSSVAMKVATKWQKYCKVN